SPVCRIVTVAGRQGFGTGFLVAPDVVITNNHVLGSKAAVLRATAEFSFERDVRRREISGRVAALDPDRLFVTNSELDFTLVALSRSDAPPHEDFGFLPLNGEEGKIRVTAPVNIIQHPDARRKEVIVRESYLKQLPPGRDAFAYYTGDTEKGSSGSPVLNDLWEVVALHHAGVPDMDDQGRPLDKHGSRWDPAVDPRGETIRWIANEGVRISRIVNALRRVLPTMPQGEEGRALLTSVLDEGERAARDGGFAWLQDRPLDAHDGAGGEAAEAQFAGPQDRSVMTIPFKLKVSIEGG
ncbi:MAG: serine protease, partial [Pseudomonadota bacterium]